MLTIQCEQATWRVQPNRSPRSHQHKRYPAYAAKDPAVANMNRLDREPDGLSAVGQTSVPPGKAGVNLKLTIQCDTGQWRVTLHTLQHAAVAVGRQLPVLCKER